MWASWHVVRGLYQWSFIQGSRTTMSDRKEETYYECNFTQSWVPLAQFLAMGLKWLSVVRVDTQHEVGESEDKPELSSVSHLTRMTCRGQSTWPRPHTRTLPRKLRSWRKKNPKGVRGAGVPAGVQGQQVDLESSPVMLQQYPAPWTSLHSDTAAAWPHLPNFTQFLLGLT